MHGRMLFGDHYNEIKKIRSYHQGERSDNTPKPAIFIRNYLRFLAMNINSRIDITQVFCDVDDFYQAFQKYSQSLPTLTSFIGEKLCSSRQASK